jgi:hypothetical protein
MLAEPEIYTHVKCKKGDFILVEPDQEQEGGSSRFLYGSDF